jgi:hypothetical protein
MWCVDPGPPWTAIAGGLEEPELRRLFPTILYHVLQGLPCHRVNEIGFSFQRGERIHGWHFERGATLILGLSWRVRTRNEWIFLKQSYVQSSKLAMQQKWRLREKAESP